MRARRAPPTPSRVARFAPGIEYDGAAFNGWQIQHEGGSGVRSVQACLEAATSRIADEPLRVVCAGRTDTGVHATAQVVHFDTAAQRSQRNWILGINSLLPADACVTWARPVADDFHARFSAVERAYTYLILCRRARSALYRNRACLLHELPDASRMQAAARWLVGTHDFSSFRAAGCQAKSPVRTVHALEVTGVGEWLRIDVRANAFLHHMVRNIAGVLIAVGRGEADVDWPRELLEVRDRRRGGVTAPAGGLYLVGVRYPQRFALPAGSPVRVGPWGAGPSF